MILYFCQQGKERLRAKLTQRAVRGGREPIGTGTGIIGVADTYATTVIWTHAQGDLTMREEQQEKEQEMLHPRILAFSSYGGLLQISMKPLFAKIGVVKGNGDNSRGAGIDEGLLEKKEGRTPSNFQIDISFYLRDHLAPEILPLQKAMVDLSGLGPGTLPLPEEVSPTCFDDRNPKELGTWLL